MVPVILYENLIELIKKKFNHSILWKKKFVHFKRWQEKHEKKINNDNDDDDDGDDNDDDDEDTEIGSHINKDDKENDDHLHFHIRKFLAWPHESWK